MKNLIDEAQRFALRLIDQIFLRKIRPMAEPERLRDRAGGSLRSPPARSRDRSGQSLAKNIYRYFLGGIGRTEQRIVFSFLAGRSYLFFLFCAIRLNVRIFSMKNLIDEAHRFAIRLIDQIFLRKIRPMAEPGAIARSGRGLAALAPGPISRSLRANSRPQKNLSIFLGWELGAQQTWVKTLVCCMAPVCCAQGNWTLQSERKHSFFVVDSSVFVRNSFFFAYKYTKISVGKKNLQRRVHTKSIFLPQFQNIVLELSVTGFLTIFGRFWTPISIDFRSFFVNFSSTFENLDDRSKNFDNFLKFFIITKFFFKKPKFFWSVNFFFNQKSENFGVIR